MKVYFKNKLAHEFLYKGFDFIVYDAYKKAGRWKVHFPSFDHESLEYTTKNKAIEAAEKIIEEKI